jgi:hypothetical protein
VGGGGAVSEVNAGKTPLVAGKVGKPLPEGKGGKAGTVAKEAVGAKETVGSVGKGVRFLRGDDAEAAEDVALLRTALPGE